MPYGQSWGDWLKNANIAVGYGRKGGDIASGLLAQQAEEKKEAQKKKASEEELQRIEAIGDRALALGRDGIAAVLTGQSTGNPQRDQVAASFKAQMDLRVKEGAYTQAEVNKGIRYALSLQTLVIDPIQRVADERTQSGLKGIERGRQISGAQGNPLMQMSGTALSNQLGGLPVGEAAERVSQYYGGNPQIFSQLPFNEPTYGLATSPQGTKTPRLVRNAQGVYVEAKPGVRGYDRPRSEGTETYAPDMQKYIHKRTGQTIQVNVRDQNAVNQAMNQGYQPIGPLQSGYLTEEGKGGAKYANKIAAEARTAQANIVTLSSMNDLLDRFQSGKTTNITKNVQQWANAFGLPIDTTNLSSKEAFTAMGEQLALQSRNLGEGMVLAGQMSDRDVQFLRDMNPQLLISKSGNRLIVKIRKAIAQRSIETARYAKEYRDQNNGVLDSLGFQEYLRNKLGNKSAFGIPEGAQLAGEDKVTGLPVYEINGKLYIPNF